MDRVASPPLEIQTVSASAQLHCILRLEMNVIQARYPILQISRHPFDASLSRASRLGLHASCDENAQSKSHGLEA